MKNNKGLTLVELLAVLVVLGLIVVIVVPTVTKNLKSSRVQLCEHQLDSLKSASKNWLTDRINDNYNEVYANGNFQNQIVTGKTLLDEGYVSKLESDYYEVEIEISREGSSYYYIIMNEDKYCK